MAKEGEGECGICCEKFNKTTRRQVSCGGCEVVSCMACVRRFLSEQEDPQCMGCRKVWDREHLMSVLPKSFIVGEMRAHRENVLLDREKALLPDTMPLVNAYRHANHLKEVNHDIYKRLQDMRKEIRVMERMHEENSTFIHRVHQSIARGEAPPEFGTHMGKDAGRTGVPRVVCGCPSNGCRGFIHGDNHQCGICEIKVCKDCHEIITDAQQAADAAEPHVCKPENVESAQLIAKSTKACPKCAVAIFKIDGCDQMWCTQCKTAFSWRTGAIETHVHNPHYYEWMRTQGNGEMRREPGDIPCGGLIHFAELLRWLRKAQLSVDKSYNIHGELKSNEAIPEENEKMGKQLTDFHRLISHCIGVEVVRYEVPTRQQNAELRVKYMMNEISEAEFKRQVLLKEKRIEKSRTLRQIMEMFTGAASDIYRNMIGEKPSKRTSLETAKQFHEQLMSLRDYTNTCFNKVSKSYDCSVPLITMNTVSHQKY